LEVSTINNNSATKSTHEREHLTLVPELLLYI